MGMGVDSRPTFKLRVNLSKNMDFIKIVQGSAFLEVPDATFRCFSEFSTGSE